MADLEEVQHFIIEKTLELLSKSQQKSNQMNICLKLDFCYRQTQMYNALTLVLLSVFSF